MIVVFKKIMNALNDVQHQTIPVRTFYTVSEDAFRLEPYGYFSSPNWISYEACCLSS